MPNDSSSTPAPFFTDTNSNDNGLPTYSPSPSTSTTQTLTAEPIKNDLDEQMETPEPMYTKEHPTAPSTLPMPDFSTMDEREEEESEGADSQNAQEESNLPAESINEPSDEAPTPSEESTKTTMEPPVPIVPETPVKAIESPVIPLYSQPKPVTPLQPPLPPTPATLPDPDVKPLGIATMLLGLLSLLAIAASSFLFLQNRTLKQQINVLQSTQAGRETPNIEITPTPEGTMSATPTPSQTATFSAFFDLSKILSIAKQESATAQMLMITSDNIAMEQSSVYKYWFRRGPSQQQYFYIQHSRLGEPQLYTQASISPDNNIPDLTVLYEANQLGIDDQTALTIGWNEINKNKNYQNPTKVTAKFIRSRPSNPEITENINLWQLTYTVTGKPDIIVQVNANTSQIVYSTQ